MTFQLRPVRASGLHRAERHHALRASIARRRRPWHWSCRQRSSPAPTGSSN